MSCCVHLQEPKNAVMIRAAEGLARDTPPLVSKTRYHNDAHNNFVVLGLEHIKKSHLSPQTFYFAWSGQISWYYLGRPVQILEDEDSEWKKWSLWTNYFETLSENGNLALFQSLQMVVISALLAAVLTKVADLAVECQ